MQTAYRKLEKKKGGGVQIRIMSVCMCVFVCVLGGKGQEKTALQQHRQLTVRSLSPRWIRAEAQCMSRHSFVQTPPTAQH